MIATPAHDKVSALLWLAGGKSNRVAAEAAGVSPSTVATWKRDPVFAAELDAVRAVYEQNPQDGRALVERLEQAEQRLTRKGPVAIGAGGTRVRVSIPPGASPRKTERLIARGIAQGLRAAREAGS